MKHHPVRGPIDELTEHRVASLQIQLFDQAREFAESLAHGAGGHEMKLPGRIRMPVDLVTSGLQNGFPERRRYRTPMDDLTVEMKMYLGNILVSGPVYAE